MHTHTLGHQQKNNKERSKDELIKRGKNMVFFSTNDNMPFSNSHIVAHTHTAESITQPGHVLWMGWLGSRQAAD